LGFGTDAGALNLSAARKKCARDARHAGLDPVSDRKEDEKSSPGFTMPKDVASLLKAIDGYTGDLITTEALRLLALFFCRPDELRKDAFAG